MNSQPFRVKISVSTKLLVSMVLVLVGTIFALNLTAIFVLSGDKRQVVYQQQNNVAYLVGRDVAGRVQRDLDALRFALSNLDPKNPSSWTSRTASLKNVINNQIDLALIRIQRVNLSTKDLAPITEVARTDLLKIAEVQSNQVSFPKALLAELAPLLKERGYAIFNASVVGGVPLLGFLVLDLKNPIAPGSYLAAMGVTAMTDWTTAKHTQLTLTDRAGWVLCDTDPAIQFQQLNIKNDTQFASATENPLSSGTLEFKNSNGRFLGSYYKPGFDLVVLAKTPWNYAMRSVFALMEKFILIGLLAIGLAVIFALFYTRSLVSPLNRLYDATKEISKGKFDVNLAVKGKDEISALTHSFNLMSKEISELILAKVKQAHLENEVAIASTVQQNLIPASEVNTPEMRIRSYYRSAALCGGDWWGHFTVGDYACFAIADATGHGLPSALITAAMRSCYSVIHKLVQDHPEQVRSPAEILSYANRAIFESAKGQIMMTLFLGVVDLKTGKMTYASAGHNPPWLFKKSPDGLWKRKSLMAAGPRLGEGLDTPTFEENEVKIEKGDLLFLFTDGLIEGRDLQGVEYSKKRAVKIGDEVVNDGPAAMIHRFAKEVETHNLQKELDDDVTLAAIEFQKIG